MKLLAIFLVLGLFAVVIKAEGDPEETPEGNKENPEDVGDPENDSNNLDVDLKCMHECDYEKEENDCTCPNHLCVGSSDDDERSYCMDKKHIEGMMTMTRALGRR